MANRKSARIAGLWYLASIVLGVIGEFAGDSEPMSTIGYFCGLAGYICFIVVVLKLYELFHKVSRILAMLMVCFVVIGIVIAVIGEGFGFATVAGIFWGLWLLPLAILILKSNLIPRAIGILLIVGCICHIADFVVVSFFSESTTFILSIVYIGEMIAEFSFVLWLLIKGADMKEKKN
jgi:hypothetical protein